MVFVSVRNPVISRSLPAREFGLLAAVSASSVTLWVQESATATTLTRTRNVPECLLGIMMFNPSDLTSALERQSLQCDKITNIIDWLSALDNRQPTADSRQPTAD